MNVLPGPALLQLSAFLAALLLLGLLEARFPFRPLPGRWRHRLVNLSLGVLNTLLLGGAALTVSIALRPRPRGGLLAGETLSRLPPALRFVALAVLLDLLLWSWHAANHRVSWLWRFHRLHHTDTELDVTSASRFHIGELVPGHVLTAGGLLLLGADAWTAAGLHALTSLVSQLQHANVRWSPRLEAILALVFVPPSLHAIHHSREAGESLSNYGTLFSVWDRLFRTLRTAPARADVRTGVA